MGRACMADMEEHRHEHFVWITPRHNLINARCGSLEIVYVGDANLPSPFGHKGVLFEPAIEHNRTEKRRSG